MSNEAATPNVIAPIARPVTPEQVQESRLMHFVRLARRGHENTGASGGEVAARKLAIAMIENAAGLDAKAIEGAILFLHTAWGKPQHAQDLVSD